MPKIRNDSMTATPKKILCLCWITYTLLYMLRLNFSVALPLLEKGESYTNAQLGVISSLFFATYTCGQLVNGALGDRLNRKRLLVAGVLLSIICNIGCGTSDDLIVLGICWMINGFAQSMLWGPIVRTLSMWFDAGALGKISFYMSLTGVVGYGIAWSLASFLGSFGNWRLIFLIPVLPMLLVVVLLIVFFQDSPPIPGRGEELSRKEGVIEDGAAKAGMRSQTPLRRYLLEIQFPLLFVIGVSLGLVREGINAWLPSLLDDIPVLSGSVSRRILTVIPLCTFIGLLAAKRVSGKLNNDYRRSLLLILSICMALAAFLQLFGRYHVWLGLFVMMVLLSLISGSSSLFVSRIPFELSAQGRASLTAGLMDFSVYCGAALASAVTGMLLEHYSWNWVYVLWLAGTLCGLVSVLFWNVRIEKENII